MFFNVCSCHGLWVLAFGLFAWAIDALQSSFAAGPFVDGWRASSLGCRGFRGRTVAPRFEGSQHQKQQALRVSVLATVNTTGNPTGHGSCIKYLSRYHNINPIWNPMSIINMTLPSMLLAVAHIRIPSALSLGSVLLRNYLLNMSQQSM